MPSEILLLAHGTLTTILAIALGAVATYAMRVHRRAKEARAMLGGVAEALDHLAGGLIVWDAEDRLLHFDQSAAEVYDRIAHAVVKGTRFEDMIREGVRCGQYPAASGREEEFIREVVETHRRPNGAFERQLSGGRWLLISERRTRNGMTVGIRTEITALKNALADAAEARAKIEQLAHYDPLTGLPNRVLFRQRLDEALRTCAPSLLCIDLDGFKSVNDTFGHGAGDELLAAVAARIVGTVSSLSTVARLGGDEFAVILTDPVVAEAVAERIVRAMADPFPLELAKVEIGASVGIGFAKAGDTSKSLLRRSDEALYAAKRAGRGTWRATGVSAEPRVNKVDWSRRQSSS